MTDHTKHRLDINRRNALKALAAATGAAGIAALPTRWSKPMMMVGAVPAHAQASICGPLTFVAASNGGNVCSFGVGPGIFGVVISQAIAGVELNLTTEIVGNVFLTSDPAGNYFTNGAGEATTGGFTWVIGFGSSINFTWSFVNPEDGCDEITVTLYCDNTP